VFIEEICAMLGLCFNKNGWKYKAQTNVEFQGVIKSLYIGVFRRAHVLNDTLFLEFAHVVVVKNKEIKTNWATYALSASRRQRSFETTRKTWHKNLLQFQECSLQAQQNGGVVTPHVAPSFGLQGNSIVTSLTTNVALLLALASLSGGAIPPPSILSLRIPHPPSSLALHYHPKMRAPKASKVEGSSSKKGCCIHNEESHSFVNHSSTTIYH
jgi:hypothetical protein